MIWLFVSLALLTFIGACAYALNDTCKREIDAFARAVGACRTLTELVKLETDIVHYKDSQCWFEWNHAKCTILLQRLRHMRTIAEFTSK